MAAQDVLLRQDENGLWDVRILDGDIAGDASLGSAVLVSLFSDARAEGGELPPEYDDPRGFWADALTDRPLGSKLWTLYRSKQTPETLAAAEQYASDALRWMVEEGWASSVEVEAEDPAMGLLALTVRITRANPYPDRRATIMWRAVVQEDGSVTITGEE